MSDFDSFLKEELKQEAVRREYYRIDPFYQLAEQIILLRKQRGITQKELAEKAGTTQAVVSRIENASVRASLETVVRLAEALDAVVDLNLKPVEELVDKALEQGPAAAPCTDDPQSVAPATQPPEGGFYFGRAPKAACQELIWFRPDPENFGIHSQSSSHKRKTRHPEIA